MSTPTPVAVSIIDPTTLWFPVGVSKESQQIKEFVQEYKANRQKPASFAWRDSLVEDVTEILHTCSVRGWDGYDAEPASPDSAIGMIELLMNLPEGIQPPDAVPEPNGNVALEWRADDHRVFSLIVTGTTIVYAGRFGGSSRKYGEERFFGVIPQTILEILIRYFPLG